MGMQAPAQSVYRIIFNISSICILESHITQAMKGLQKLDFGLTFALFKHKTISAAPDPYQLRLSGALSVLILHDFFNRLTKTLILLSFFYIGHLIEFGFFSHLQIIFVALFNRRCRPCFKR